jgi:hypothetical protein
MLSGHVRAWGRYHSRILDRWAANLGRSEGAIAEEAVPFPGAVRRSLVVLRCARPIYAAGFSAVVPAHVGRLLERRDHVAPTLTRAIASMTSVSPSGANKRMSPSAGQAPSLSSKQLARQSRMWVCPAWHSSTGRARRAILITALCAAAPLAHAQQLPSIESLEQSYVACVQTAFLGRLDDFAVNGNLAQVAERALLDCQIEENALYTTAVSSGVGHAQAIALTRVAVEQLKASLKAKMLAPPTAMLQKK